MSRTGWSVITPVSVSDRCDTCGRLFGRLATSSISYLEADQVRNSLFQENCEWSYLFRTHRVLCWTCRASRGVGTVQSNRSMVLGWPPWWTWISCHFPYGCALEPSWPLKYWTLNLYYTFDRTLKIQTILHFCFSVTGLAFRKWPYNNIESKMHCEFIGSKI